MPFIHPMYIYESFFMLKNIVGIATRGTLPTPTSLRYPVRQGGPASTYSITKIVPVPHTPTLSLLFFSTHLFYYEGGGGMVLPP